MIKRIIVLDGQPASIRLVPRAAYPQAVSSLAAGPWHLVNAISGPNAWTVDDGASVPDQPVSGQWSVVPGDEPGEVIFTVINLNGGGAITAHEYQIGDESWVQLSGGGATGPRSAMMPDDGAEYAIRYRRRNALEPSLPSDQKPVVSFFNAVRLSGPLPSLAMTQSDDPRTLAFDDFVAHAEGYQFGIAALAGVSYAPPGLTATADQVRAGVSIPVKAFGAANSEFTFNLSYSVDAAQTGDDPMILRGGPDYRSRTRGAVVLSSNRMIWLAPMPSLLPLGSLSRPS